MAELSKTDQKRITILSLIGSSEEETLVAKYEESVELVAIMEDDDLFDGSGNSRSSQRSTGSRGRGSDSRRSSGGRSGGGGGNRGMRDPDGPPSDKQVNAVLNYTDDFTEDELWDMTKKEVSDLIDDLGIFK